MSTPKDTLVSITPDQLEAVAGGASRSSGSSEVTAALTSIQSSIKDLAGNQNQGMDPMMMMVMMMMMGGGGGGGGGYVAAAPAVATPPVINIATDVAGGGGMICPRRGKKGW